MKYKVSVIVVTHSAEKYFPDYLGGQVLLRATMNFTLKDLQQSMRMLNKRINQEVLV